MFKATFTEAKEDPLFREAAPGLYEKVDNVRYTKITMVSSDDTKKIKDTLIPEGQPCGEFVIMRLKEYEKLLVTNAILSE